MTGHEELTVIVPVYRGIDDVVRCIESVLHHGAEQPFQLLVIDDASPEAEITEYLAGLRSPNEDIDVRVLHNDENLGFVRTVNRGLEQSNGDVVILNADTVVTAGWLDRLRAVATSQKDVATVTPLTNFGSFCTLPDSMRARFALDTESPQIDACAAFVEQHSLHRYPEVVAGVGFCLYVRRSVLDECGPLDEETFGPGYGEEVDFCLRATRLGYRNVVDDSTFVYHRGGGSFGDEREEGLARGSAILRHRYPFFRPYNTLERRHEPLAISFAALEQALAERDPNRPHVLHLLHSDPNEIGGTEKHLASLISALLPRCDFSVLHPVTSGFVLRTHWQSDEGPAIQHEYLLPGAPRRVTKVSDANAAFALRSALDLFTFDAVHIQNLINHSLAPLEVLADFDGQVVCSVRDLFLACPSHWLLYKGQACGIPEDLTYCETCLPETRELELDYLLRFRETVQRTLETVDSWVFASQSAVDYMLRVYELPMERVEIIPHGAMLDLRRRPKCIDEELVHSEPLRLAFVGLGRAKKGLDTVSWLADALAHTDIEVHHFGELAELASDNIVLHGEYDNVLLPEMLERFGIQVVLLPGPYAETFGHVMTEALFSGRPVIGATYGALGERIRATGAGWTVDPMDRQALLDLVRNLDACRQELHRASEAAHSVKLRSVEATADRYLDLYTRGGSRDQ